MIKLKPDDGENVVEDMFGNKVDWNTMMVTNVTEHEDGGATFTLDMTNEQVKMFMDIFLRSAVVAGLRHAEEGNKDAIETLKQREGQKTQGKAKRKPANRRRALPPLERKLPKTAKIKSKS